MDIILDKKNKDDAAAFEIANKFITHTVQEITNNAKEETIVDLLVKNELVTREEFAKITQQNVLSKLQNVKQELDKNKIILPVNEQQIIEQKVQKLSIDIIEEVIIGMEILVNGK